MSHDFSEPECRRRGVIMACYQDGRRRFRAALIETDILASDETRGDVRQTTILPRQRLQPGSRAFLDR